MNSGYTNPNVLVVDDCDLHRELMVQILESLGLSGVRQAASGQAALEILQTGAWRPDLVLCDLRMPEMDGIELLRHVTALPHPPAFAFLTGEHGGLLSAAVELAQDRGVNVLGAVGKPVSLTKVKQLVDRLSDPKRPAPKAAAAGTLIPSRYDLVEAIKRDEFCLYFQPKLSLANDVIVGFESLIRWHHPILGLVGPGAFISEAERLGVIRPLTEWVFAKAIQQAAAWNAKGLKTKISVNFSPVMLENLALPDRLATETAHAGIDPSQLVLEITESGLFNDDARGLEILARLHLKGFNLSIDDFGTGYSSMHQLRRLPFTEMKIDRSFVHGCCEDDRMRAILETSTDLARRLGMTVVAEGPEREDELALLRDLGIEMAQGFVIAKPMPAADAWNWLAARAEAAPSKQARVGG